MAKLDNGPARGTRDFLPAEVARREEVVATIASCYAGFGFRRIETPSIESIERLTAGQGGENEKLIFKILRRGLPAELETPTSAAELTDLALRYDLTVPLTRFYAQHLPRLPEPFRALQIGNVWRAERPGKGRYRQFTQCDIDTLGEASVLAECELLEATATALTALEIRPITIRLNDRRLLGAIAAASGVEEALTAGYFIALDKLEKIGWTGVEEELAARGVEAASAGQTRELVEALNEAREPSAVVARAAELLPGLPAGVLEDLATTAGALDRLAEEGAGGLGVEIDPTIVRGMGYYTGQIFEVAHPASSSSIAGGGRYDELVGRSLGRPVPACGISIGFDRMVDLAAVAPTDLGVAVLYGDEERAAVLASARKLRSEGLAATLVPRRKAMRQQLSQLAEEGYSGFVTVEGGVAGGVRPLGKEPS